MKEVTLYMVSSMNLIVRKCFLKAEAITDRFHIQQLVNDAIQELRIKHRWEIMNSENGNTLRQPMARSRYTSINPVISGLSHKNKERNYSLKDTLISKLHIIYLMD